MMGRLEQTFYRMTAACWGIFVALILPLILVFAHFMTDSAAATSVLPDFVLLLIGLVVLTGATWLCRRIRSVPAYTIYILSALVFILQAIVFYNMYFESGWDSGVVVSSAREAAAGTEITQAAYFSRYPNNVLICGIYTGIFKLAAWLGLGAYDLYFGILFQSLLSCLCGYWLYKAAETLVGWKAAYLAWGVYVLHVAFSPWLSILYSDPLVLCVPMGIFRLYQLTQNGKMVPLKWACIGLLAYFGYKLKPQAVIILIAILLVEGVCLVCRLDKATVCKFLRNVGACGVAALAGMLLFAYGFKPALPMTYDTNLAFGPAHYVMMGLNQQTYGGYHQNDVAFSAGFDNQAERKEANWKIAEERAASLGVSGLLRHAARKTLTNYGDGTYAWFLEGTFQTVTYPDRNNSLSPFLKSMYYQDGAGYSVFTSVQQGIWLTVLFCTGCSVVYFFRQKERDISLVLPLSLLGLTLFGVIFEARARYLFAYAPLYILCGVLGWVTLVRYVRRSRRS